MSKVIVVYDKLQSTAENLQIVMDNIQKYITTFGEVRESLENAGKTHDKCFGDSIRYLEGLEKIFIGYKNEVLFLKNQCNDIYKAFKNKENESANASDEMLTVINRANMMLGNNTIDADEVELKIYKDPPENINENINFELSKITNTDISNTWENTFYINKNGVVLPKRAIREYVYKPTGTDLTSLGTTAAVAGAGIVTTTTTTTTTTSPSTTEKSTDDKKEEAKEEKKSETTKKEETKKEDKSDKTTTKKETEQAPDVIKEPASYNKETTPKATDKPGGNEKFITVTPSTPTNPTIAPQTPTTPTQVHTGGGYSGGGYTSSSYTPAATPTETPQNPTDQIGTTIKDTSKTSIDDIVKSSKYTKIPTSSTPITQQQTSNKGGASAVIPIAAGLTAAAAAGLGAKAYMDHKKNNEEQDDEEEFNADEWSDDYNTSEDTNNSELQTEYLEEDNNYSYEQEPEEKYGARSNEELADLQ